MYANSETPKPSKIWRELSDSERKNFIDSVLATQMPSMIDILTVTSAKDDGQIIVKLANPLSADKRGTVLLDFETLLKDKIDPGLVVWLDTLGDRNSLRNLRGIEVKS